jgi:hypothetical protein
MKVDVEKTPKPEDTGSTDPSTETSSKDSVIDETPFANYLLSKLNDKEMARVKES